MTDRPHDLAHLRGLALGTIFPGFAGTSRPPEWVTRLAAEGLGGVVLFGRNIDPERGDAGVAELTAALRATAPHLLVAIDEEGGDVTRLDVARGSSTPGNAALGALDDLAATEDVAAELGARLRAVGIDVNFAPVADVDVHPDNPVIGVRAFGFDPELVARHVGAFVAGLQGQGVVAAAKHFPGHGGTAEDSHLTVPVLDEPIEVLRRRELTPFRAALKADVKIVMTAHILARSLDDERPATLSPAVITDLLRDQLGYGGVVMTDGLDMHAISRTVGHAEAGVQALLAGVDALCIGGDSTDVAVAESMVAALVSAVVEGRLPYERLAEAAGRVRSLREWIDEMRCAPTVPEGAAELTSGPAAGPAPQPATRRAARAAVVVHGSVQLSGPALVVEFHDEPTLAAGEVPWGVGRALQERAPHTVVVAITADGPTIVEVLAAHPDRPLVLAVRGTRRRGWQRAAVAAARGLRPHLVVVDHDVASTPDVLGEHFVLAHGAARVTAEAAADALLGRAREGGSASR